MQDEKNEESLSQKDHIMFFDNFKFIIKDRYAKINLEEGAFEITSENDLKITCFLRKKDGRRFYFINGGLYVCTNRKEGQYVLRNIMNGADLVTDLGNVSPLNNEELSDVQELPKYIDYGDFQILYELLPNEQSTKIKVQYDPLSFTLEKQVGEVTHLKRNKDGKKFYMCNNLLYSWISTSGGSDDGTVYHFVYDILNSNICMLHENGSGSLVYQIKNIVECTGDDTCEHCSECTICSALHCDHGKENGA